MKNHYSSEIEAMQDFYQDLLNTLNKEERKREKERERERERESHYIDYSCNTDGRINGTLFEFKLNFTDIYQHKKQIERYIKSFNSSGNNPPKYTYLVSINEKKFIKIDNLNGSVKLEAQWNHPNDFIIHDEVLAGWIDEYSIAAWNNHYCAQFKNANKEDVKNELINPKFLNIIPFKWDEQLTKKKSTVLTITG